MKIFNTILRILVGLIFFLTGAFHLYAYKFMAVYVPLPFGSKVFVIIIGLLLCLSSLAILLNKMVRTSLTTIATILAFTGLMVLTPMIFRNPDELVRAIELPNLYKLMTAFVVFIYLALKKSN